LKSGTVLGVEDLWVTVTRQRFLQASTQKVVSRVLDTRQASTAANTIDDRHQEDEASRHWDVRDVGGPDLVDSGNLQIVQQIRVDGVLRGWLARVGFGHRALESHQPHQPLPGRRHGRRVTRGIEEAASPDCACREIPGLRWRKPRGARRDSRAHPSGSRWSGDPPPGPGARPAGSRGARCSSGSSRCRPSCSSSRRKKRG